MSIKIGSLELSDLYVGSNPVQAVYQGSNLIWQRGPVTDEPFWVSSDEAFDIQLTKNGTVNAVPEISTDLSAWMTLAPGETYSYQAGQKVYVRNTASNDWSISTSKFLSFVTNCTFTKVGGNIKSLVNNSETLPNYVFAFLFYDNNTGNTYLKDASQLIFPWTTFSNYGCREMFRECPALTAIPSLPATILGSYSYYYMFYRCNSIQRSIPLRATTLGIGCYRYMFGYCTALETLPALPATTLLDYCYAGMFDHCSKIKISATQTGEYTNEYRIPITGEGTTAGSSLTGMFSYTGGTFISTPTINTTYYTSNEVIS